MVTRQTDAKLAALRRARASADRLSRWARKAHYHNIAEHLDFVSLLIEKETDKHLAGPVR